jgi:hypothetical protein
MHKPVIAKVNANMRGAPMAFVEKNQIATG